METVQNNVMLSRLVDNCIRTVLKPKKQQLRACRPWPRDLHERDCPGKGAAGCLNCLCTEAAGINALMYDLISV